MKAQGRKTALGLKVQTQASEEKKRGTLRKNEQGLLLRWVMRGEHELARKGGCEKLCFL